jgi:hypothetical protein
MSSLSNLKSSIISNGKHRGPVKAKSLNRIPRHCGAGPWADVGS